MSFGGGSSNSSSSQFMESVSENISQMWQDATSQGSTFVDPNQQGFTDQLWQSAFSGINPQQSADAAWTANAQTAPGLSQGFNNMVGLTDPTSQIAAQEASLASGLGDLFTNEMMPALQSDAMVQGGFGGGRQGVAEGVAAGEIANAYTQGLGDITAAANNTAVQAGSQLPGMSQGLYDSWINPTMAGGDALSQLASILGPQTILSQNTSQSSGGSDSSGYSQAGSGGSTSQEGWDFSFGWG